MDPVESEYVEGMLKEERHLRDFWLFQLVTMFMVNFKEIPDRETVDKVSDLVDYLVIRRRGSNEALKVRVH